MSSEIDEFSQEFFQEILSGADAEGQLNEDIFFEKFCSHLIDAGEIDTADRACYRGPSSSGIRVDGYAGDPIESQGTLTLVILDFVQSPEVITMNRNQMQALVERPIRFVREALKPEWRNALEETSPGFGLADLVAQRWNSIKRIRVILATNRELKLRVDVIAAGRLDGRDVTHSVWDISRLHRYIISGREREEIVINLEEFGEPLPLLPAYLRTEDYEAYLVVVPGQMLGEIYDRWGARLLEQNVRVFLQAKSNVNKGIRKTLEEHPSMFFAYNNGITATAEKVKTVQQGTQVLLTELRNFQIVNGGQTTASIHAALRRKMDISRVFVQMKLSIVNPEQTDEVVPRISEYANSQNRVNAADFFANHPFHISMEKFSRRLWAPAPDGTLRQTKWFYERARGQYADERSLSKLTLAQRKQFDQQHPRSQLFSKTDLAKYQNVWLGRPDVVSLGAQKNFANFASEVGKSWEKSEASRNSFNEAYFRETVAKAIIFKKTERIVSSQPWYQGGYRANIVAYAIAKLAHDVNAINRAVDFEYIWKQQSVSFEMEQALAHTAKEANEVLVNPPAGISNVTEWAKKKGCWDRLRDKSIKMTQTFRDELILREEQEKRTKDAVKVQKIDNGIEAQSFVVNTGPNYWQSVLQWAQERDLLSIKETGVITAATKQNKIPTESQSLFIVKVHNRLKNEGLPDIVQ